MRKSTDKKLGAILCAALIVGILLFSIAAVFLMAWTVMAWTGAAGDAVGWFALGIFFVMFGAIIACVLLALRQRLKEIRGGEEEDAKKY